MKVLRYAILACLLLAGCATTGAGNAHLRYDGVYRSPGGMAGGTQYWIYVRFYPDGEEISTSARDTPQELATWLSRGNGSVRHGKVTIKGSHVSFQDTSPYGAVDYEGEIRGDTVRFHTVSHINGYVSDEDYTFIPLELPRDGAPAGRRQP